LLQAISFPAGDLAYALGVSHHPRFEPMPERANEVALDMALRPFVDRFVEEDKRARARAALTPKHGRFDWHAVLQLITTRRGRTFAQDELKPWHAVRGVFLVDRDAFSVDAKAVADYYVTDAWMFVSYGATFAVIHDEAGHSLLYT
jgi:hypothetical protein